MEYVNSLNLEALPHRMFHYGDRNCKRNANLISKIVEPISEMKPFISFFKVINFSLMSAWTWETHHDRFRFEYLLFQISFSLRWNHDLEISQVHDAADEKSLDLM